MDKKKKKDLIALGILSVASIALGAYMSKKENRDKIKKELSKTNESLKNKLDEMDYKYHIIPCNEIYHWDSDTNDTKVTIFNKAKSIDDLVVS